MIDDFLLDSVILIDHARQIELAKDFLKKFNPDKYYISVVTRAEVLSGADKQSLELTKLILSGFECIAIDEKIADRAALVRKQFRLKLPDAFQYAIAVENNMKLVTRNTKDFSFESENILIPYTL